MQDFKKKRIEYINNWPKSKLFPAEEIYKNKCIQFEQEGRKLFQQLRMWESSDENYNMAISHLIDCLEMLPLKPNHAFLFLFFAIDSYSEIIFQNMNMTNRLKKMADTFATQAVSNIDLLDIFNTLFEVMPVQVGVFLLNELYTPSVSGVPCSQCYKRVTEDEKNTIVLDRKDLLDSIWSKYFQGSPNNDSIRKCSCLLRKLFLQDKVLINGKNFDITLSTRLHILISGVIYSFRNKTTHGDSMAFSKSSMCDQKRYALNYFCFFTSYVILMILLINGDYSGDKNLKIKELKDITIANCNSIKKFFGSNLS